MTDHSTYLIVGGGMTADSAAKGIRAQDPDGTITILGEEEVAPFPRPALSKKLWTDADFSRDDAALETEGETGASLRLGTTVTGLDTGSRSVTCADGSTLTYERLLLATGCSPRRLDGVPPGDRVIYFRTLPDYERLRALAADHPHVAVVGGGYIGCEIAAALVQHDCQVTLVHPGKVLGDHMYPASLAATLERAFTDAGVTVRGGTQVEAVEPDGDSQQRLRLDDGSALTADVVVLGLGVAPATSYAEGSVDLADDGAVVVGEDLRTSAEHVWAAGDVAQYPDRILGRRRVEHVDNATTMGETVGRIMAGSGETYDHTPMFYSDLFDHWYEAVGTLDSSMETVEDPRDGGAVVVYYLDDDAVRGVLLWDCDGGLDGAKALLAEGGRPDDAQDLVGRVNLD